MERTRRRGARFRWLWAAAAVFGALLSAEIARADEPCGRTRFITTYDSHGLTAFGDRLDEWLLSQPGGELTSYTLGGATPEWLLRGTVSPRGYFYKSCDKKPILPRSKFKQKKVKTPVIEELLRVPDGTYERQVVLISLGSNVPGLPSVLTPKVEKVVRGIAHRSEALCIWVSPPSMRTWSAPYAEKVYQAIQDGIRAAEAGSGRTGPLCHLIDSRKLSEYPKGGDGTHYAFSERGNAAARKWAEGVIGEVERILRATEVASRRAAPPVAQPSGGTASHTR